ncbi:MAG: hypothetical protein Q7R79_03150 [bacterium]|nr:hypothetical protein [bacterium]
MKKRFFDAVQSCVSEGGPEPLESLGYDSLIKKAKSLFNPAIRAQESLPRWWQWKRITLSELKEDTCHGGCKKRHGFLSYVNWLTPGFWIKDADRGLRDPDHFMGLLLLFFCPLVTCAALSGALIALKWGIFPGLGVGIVLGLVYVQISMLMRLGLLKNIVRYHHKDLSERGPKTESAYIQQYERHLVQSYQEKLIGEDSLVQKLDRELSKLLQTAEGFRSRFKIRIDSIEEQDGEIPFYLRENVEDNLKLIGDLGETQTELRKHIGVINGFFAECYAQLKHLDEPLDDLGLIEEYAQFKEQAAVKPIDVKNAIAASSASLSIALRDFEREFSKITSHPPVPSLPQRPSSGDFKAIEEVVEQYLTIPVPKVPDLSSH